MPESYDPPKPTADEFRRRAIRESIESRDSQEKRRIRIYVFRQVRQLLRNKYPDEWAELHQAQPCADPHGNPIPRDTRMKRSLAELAYLHKEEAEELRLAIWDEIRNDT